MAKFIPKEFFEGRANDSGRICKDCRFHVFQGAKMEPSEAVLGGDVVELGPDYWEDVDPQFDTRRGKVERLSSSLSDHRDIILKFQRMRESSEDSSHTPPSRSPSRSNSRSKSKSKSKKKQIKYYPSQLSSGDDDLHSSSLPRDGSFLSVKLENADDPLDTLELQLSPGETSLAQLYHKCILRDVFDEGILFLYNNETIDRELWHLCYLEWMGPTISYRYIT